MNGTTNPGWKSNPEPPYAGGKDGISDTDYTFIKKALNDLGLAMDWLDEVDEDCPSIGVAQNKMREARAILRELI